MTNTPLCSTEQSKLFIFVLLLLPSLFFIVGIIAAIFLIFGLVMMKKNSDFRHVETAARIYKGYIYIALMGSGLFALYFANALFDIIKGERLRTFSVADELIK